MRGNVCDANIPPTTISPLPIAISVIMTCSSVKDPTLYGESHFLAARDRIAAINFAGLWPLSTAWLRSS